jgi:hypothetical protein
MRWLIQHVASIYNRQSTNYDGQTPHEARHGRRSNGRTAEFGEKVLYCVPNRLRAKIDMRWRVGIFLGTAERTNEAFVGTVSGNVVKSRSITRVVHASKWDQHTLLKIVGTPAAMCPNPNGNQDSAWMKVRKILIDMNLTERSMQWQKGRNHLPRRQHHPRPLHAAGSPNVDSAGPDLRTNLLRMKRISLTSLCQKRLIKTPWSPHCCSLASKMRRPRCTRPELLGQSRPKNFL